VLHNFFYPRERIEERIPRNSSKYTSLNPRDSRQPTGLHLKNFPAVFLPGAVCLLKEQPVSWATSSQLVKKLSIFFVPQI